MDYIIIGHKAIQRDDNRGLDAADQQPPAQDEIYRTDDRAEAMKIMKRGGFIKDDDWFVATNLQTDPPADNNPNAAAKPGGGMAIRKGDN